MEAINDWDRRKHSGSTPSNVTTGSYGSYNPSIMTDAQGADPTRPPPCSTRTSVYAFAFSDVVLLATPIAGERDVWMLCEDVGVARVVGVEGKDGVMSLTVLPLDVFALDAPLDLARAHLEQMHLTVPDLGRPSAPSDAWMLALSQCAQFSLLAISMPPPDGEGGRDMPGVDSGLRQRMRGYPAEMLDKADNFPIPKSPSAQIDDAQKGRREDLQRDEREERGWWHTRFQQVLWEVQQQLYVGR
ncbi:hypothetical protein K523DRAFT_320669 [Schizophyllum commune Tattone D]|nr:hypothetical protein K523DRAFT_320669 [Schizophyllum commune Tattone D]